MHGLGKTTLANGTVLHDGEWENGQPIKESRRIAHSSKV